MIMPRLISEVVAIKDFYLQAANVGKKGLELTAPFPFSCCHSKLGEEGRSSVGSSSFTSLFLIHLFNIPLGKSPKGKQAFPKSTLPKLVLPQAMATKTLP
jgi:hypothetical protein